MEGRKQFEVWFEETFGFDISPFANVDDLGVHGYLFDDDLHDKRTMLVSAAFMSWKASRESLVIDLPEGFTYHGQSDQTEYVFEAQSVVDSIQAAGVRTK